MITAGDVTGAVDPVFVPFANYIVQVANVFAIAPDVEDMIRIILLGEASYAARNAGTPVAFREALIVALNGWGMAPAPLVLAARNLAVPIVVAAPVALVPLAPPVNPRVDEKARILRNRTQRSRTHGIRLANAAAAMDGWFHWVKSGPKDPNFVGHLGVDYMPKVAWTHTQTDLGVEQHPMILNDFARWLVVPNAPAPGIGARMNCWESVLYSACRANLIDKIFLQTIHRKSALNYQFSGSQLSYYKTLSQALNFVESVPFDPGAGLIPQKGDILFWDRDSHVGVSLGRTWANGVATDHCMSLWHHANGTFAQLTLEDMPIWMQPQLCYIPCPF